MLVGQIDQRKDRYAFFAGCAAPASADARTTASADGTHVFSRGGSAQVVRSLARTLPGQGWEVTVVSGSLQLPGRPGDAHEFFAGLDLCAVDYTAALQAADPLRADPPFHPSYEDRPGAPDRVFARVDEARNGRKWHPES